MKRIILAHGWGGSPDNDWFPWTIKSLEALGYKVISPKMPDTNNPKIDIWVSYLANVVGNIQENDIFVGHSIGCQTILRFLERLDQGKVDKVILVAPWGMSLSNLDSNEEENIAKPWLETPIDFEKVKTRANSFITILSDNDPFVPFKENSEFFKDKLKAKVIQENNKGHFTESDNVKELPVLLKEISF